MFLNGLRRVALAVIAVVGFVLLAGAAQATDVTGGLYANTTWTLANSPYHVIGDVILFPGYTLTIEPGVTVAFDAGKWLTIRGTLSAVGTSANHIVFTSYAPPALWGGMQYATGQKGHGTLSYCDLSYASTANAVECCWGYNPPATFDHCTFSNCTWALSGYAGYDEIVTDCVFSNNTYAITRADKVLTDCTFSGNTYGLYQTERIDVHHCTFSGNTTALYGRDGLVENCTIQENGTGVQSYYQGFTLERNCITHNDVGVKLTTTNGGYGTVTFNDIADNRVRNAEISGSYNISAPDNWWGSTVQATIDATVFDGRDDPNLGLLMYEPFATSPNICGNSTPVQPSTWGSIKALYR